MGFVEVVFWESLNISRNLWNLTNFGNGVSFGNCRNWGGIGWHLTNSRNFGDDRKFRHCRNSKDSHNSSTFPNFQIPCSHPLFFALPPPPQPLSPLNPPSPPSSLASSPLWCCHHTSFFLACVLLSLLGGFAFPSSCWVVLLSPSLPLDGGAFSPLDIWVVPLPPHVGCLLPSSLGLVLLSPSSFDLVPLSSFHLWVVLFSLLLLGGAICVASVD